MTGRNARGSALIVVLGLMAFLSMSALAFAAYMRYSRVPSSYTRRTSAARNLVKGALARAIDAVDKAVNDNPHPNLDGPAGSGGSNRWLDRVYVVSGSQDLVGEKDTVSPLSLEALAYIPPNLVNSVRLYSRRSPTASWKTLDYDQGRYVYCAVDVSDYLDINRLFADVPRSSAPHTRFSLSYLFDDDGSENYRNPVHTGPGKNTGTWDTWMENFRKVDEKTLELDFKTRMPLISVADLSLALGRHGRIPPFTSPFHEFVAENKQDAFDNTGYAQNGQTYADVRRMTFVTDGLFPRWHTVPGHPNVKAYDLNDANNQPFPMDSLSDDASLSESMLGTGMNDAFKNKSGANGYDILSGLGCAALRDYLDTDHVPVSLAVPTTERVPMICGIETVVADEGKSFVRLTVEPKGNGNQSGGGNSGEAGGGGNTREAEVDLSFTISPDFAYAVGMGNVSVLTVFPFSHEDATDTDGYAVDGRLSFFLADVNVPVPLRPLESSKKVPHLSEKKIEPTDFTSHSGLINVKLECADKINPRGIGYPVTDEKNTLSFLSISMQDAHSALGSAFAMAGNEFLKVKLKWNQQKSGETGEWTPSANEVLDDIASGGTQYLSGLRDASCAFPALKWASNGMCEGVDGDMSSPERLLSHLIGGASKKLSLKSALWLRIHGGKDDRVVDMVPACFEDDAVHLQSSNSEPGMKSVADRCLGTSYPLMLLETGVSVDFSLAGLIKASKEGSGLNVSPRTIYVSDPRFNHAPEHWFKASGDLSREGWLAENRSYLGGRNSDIFMATSDSGYMQSKYELMFIPRFTDLTGGGAQAGWYQPPTSMHSLPSSFDETLNKSIVWKTFCPFPETFPEEHLEGGKDDADAFDALPWTNDGTNFKMTPYSDNLNAFSGVFANTPIDWKRSSTNEVEEAPFYFGMRAKEFNDAYAYNEWTSETRLAWDDVKSIAQRYMGLVRREGNLSGDWIRAWQDMDWFGEDNTLCGVSLTENGRFWSADRKFLYGFWRDCIAPKQQLYLIFVRAEPMMIGVGDLRKMPPQLGARAVGLVWRDPAATRLNGGYPHRTRLLFYRQFD